MQRVNQLIKQALGEILLNELKDPKIGFCTVTEVEVANDLRSAWVRVSVLGNEKEKQDALERLQHAAGYINRLLRSKVELRYTPRLNFKLDSSLDHAFKIEKIIQEIHEDQKQSPSEDADADEKNDSGDE